MAATVRRKLATMQYDSDFLPLKNKIDLNGKTVVDAGCGDGWLSRELAAVCGKVISLEPDAGQAARFEAASVPTNVELHVSGAEFIPAEDNSVDGVVFCYSMHHVPTDLMASVLKEAHRVIKTDGWLYVAEPVARGNYQYVMESFHDETEVRKTAQQALNKTANKLFAIRETFAYQVAETMQSFQQFVDYMAPLTYNDGYTREQVEADDVRQRFEEQRTGDTYELITPVVADLFTGKLT